MQHTLRPGDGSPPCARVRMALESDPTSLWAGITQTCTVFQRSHRAWIGACPSNTAISPKISTGRRNIIACSRPSRRHARGFDPAGFKNVDRFGRLAFQVDHLPRLQNGGTAAACSAIACWVSIANPSKSALRGARFRSIDAASFIRASIRTIPPGPAGRRPRRHIRRLGQVRRLARGGRGCLASAPAWASAYRSAWASASASAWAWAPGCSGV